MINSNIQSYIDTYINIHGNFDVVSKYLNQITWSGSYRQTNEKGMKTIQQGRTNPMIGTFFQSCKLQFFFLIYEREFVKKELSA